VNEPKSMVRLPRRNIIVVQPDNKYVAWNCNTPTKAWNLLFADSILQKVMLHTSEEISRRTATYKLITSYNGTTAMHQEYSLVCYIWQENWRLDMRMWKSFGVKSLAHQYFG
jgi:hypothetical protein